MKVGLFRRHFMKCSSGTCLISWSAEKWKHLSLWPKENHRVFYPRSCIPEVQGLGDNRPRCVHFSANLRGQARPAPGLLRSSRLADCPHPRPAQGSCDLSKSSSCFAGQSHPPRAPGEAPHTSWSILQTNCAYQERPSLPVALLQSPLPFCLSAYDVLCKSNFYTPVFTSLLRLCIIWVNILL